jgi:hypothetical protein
VSNIRDSALNRIRAADLAWQHARQAILGTVRETGGRTVTRPVFRDHPGLDMTLTDAEAIAALQASAAIAHALRRITCEYVRRAREDGHSWTDVGTALGLDHAAGDSRPAAEAAYDLVAGEPGFRARSFAWICPACRATVIDRGPDAGHPGDCEEGHATGCPRLATTITAWDASWNTDGLP